MFYMRELPSRELIDTMARDHPEIDPTAVEACYFLLRTGSDVLAAFDEGLARHHMSQSRFIVILLLNRLELKKGGPGGVSPSQLAEQAGVSRGTMTGLLDGLEREGLIERKLDNGDRRMLSIQMTEKGREVLARMCPDYYHRISGLMAELDEKDRKTLIALLTKVSQGIPALVRPEEAVR